MNFIKKNKIIIFGCNHVSDFIIPDYHFWGDKKRYQIFGKFTNKKSISVLYKNIPIRIRKRHYKISPTFVVDYKEDKDIGDDIKYYYKKNTEKIYGNFKFRNIGCFLIFYAYLNKASKISIVGMDGYTLYTKEDLDKGKFKQHCYDMNSSELPDYYKNEYFKTGYTDVINYYEDNHILNKKKNKEICYNHCVKRDKDTYKVLKKLFKRGIEFNILTPTVYKDFYNPKILNIK